MTTTDSNYGVGAPTKKFNGLEALGGLVVFFGALVFTPLISAWTVHILWGWFLVPLGIIPIGIAHAFGVIVLVNLFKANLAHEKLAKKDDEKPSFFWLLRKSFGRTISINLTAFVLGAIAHSFM